MKRTQKRKKSVSAKLGLVRTTVRPISQEATAGVRGGYECYALPSRHCCGCPYTW